MLTLDMRIMGIDPGYINIGIAILEYNNEPELLLAQDINLKDHATKYLQAFYLINDIIINYNPDIIVIEKTIVRNNNKVSLLLSQSRGVLLLCCEMNNKEYIEVANNKIKKTVYGVGNATKKDIQQFINNKFNVNLKSNANDAILIALYKTIVNT